MGAEFLFMDDIARANLVDESLQLEDITRMDLPAYSPDLNPIEHVWDMLGRRIAVLQPPPNCLPELRRETESEELAVVVVAFIEGWMVLLEMAVEAVDGLGTCVFCVDVDVTFRGRPLFRSGTTGEVSMSLKGVKTEVW
ncbi:transposable element Tc3 transposase [Trichonephila clavipes]|nr:transposable element Tc3 transposase [Trichonephila clavipes]